MISPLDTRIAFFGGAANPAVIDAVVNLANAGYSIVVASHDPRESVALRAAGCRFVGDRFEALSQCDIVMTSLRVPADVESLYLGDNGLLELMDAGSHAIDLSISTPQLAREIQTMGAISDIDVLDCPIMSLGQHEDTCVFVGGTPEAQAVLSPLFPYLAPNVLPQTDAGEGQFACMMSTIALAGSIMGTVEAMALAHIAGFDENNAVNVLATTAGASRALVDYVPRVIAHDYSGKIRVHEFLDALEVALDAAEAFDLTIPLVETAFQLYNLLSVVGGDEMNIQAIALLYEDEQTCADFGLDWALADQYVQGEGEYDDAEYNSFFHPGGRGDSFDGGPRPAGGSPHGHGPMPRGGNPPFDGFFSRN